MGRHASQSNLVYLFDRRTAQPSCVITQLEEYWTRISDGRPAPFRADIIPTEIEHLLPHFLLLERIAHGIVRIRIAGMEVSKAVGCDLRGMPLSAVFDPSARKRLPVVIENVLGTASRATLLLRSKPGFARPATTARLRLLPLMDHDGSITQLIGCLVFDTKTSRAPNRLGIHAVEYEKGQPERTAQTAPNLRLVT